MEIEEWTNDPGLWSDLNGAENKIALWRPATWRAYKNSQGVQSELDCDQRLHWSDVYNAKSFAEARLIFIIDQESEYSDWVFNDDRIYMWDMVVNDHPRIYPYFYWWDWVRMVAESIGSLDQLLPPKDPTYIFECLTGSMSPQRNHIDSRMESSKYKDSIFYNFYGKTQKWVSVGKYDKYFKVGIGTSEGSGPLFEYNEQGQQAPTSVLMPINVYNDSWFSIVSETDQETKIGKRAYVLDSKKQQLSEKTAKALLGKRMFIMFGQRHILEDLQELGFKTFSNVIDESYDDIKNDTERWNAGFDQVEYICSQNPSEVYEKVKDIILHNYNHFLSIFWEDRMFSEMKQVIWNKNIRGNKHCSISR